MAQHRKPGFVEMTKPESAVQELKAEPAKEMDIAVLKGEFEDEFILLRTSETQTTEEPATTHAVPEAKEIVGVSKVKEKSSDPAEETVTPRPSETLSTLEMPVTAHEVVTNIKGKLAGQHSSDHTRRTKQTGNKYFVSRNRSF